jgi:hypothetical protein
MRLSILPSRDSRNTDGRGPVLIALVVLVAVPTARAEPVSVSASIYGDEAGSTAADVAVVVPAGPVDLRANLGYSRIERDSGSPLVPVADVDFVYGGVGVDWFAGGLTASFDATRWGDAAIAETRDYRGSLRYDWERAAVFVSGVYRNVEATVPRVVAGQLVTEERSLDVPGYGAGVEWQATERLRLYASAEDQQYDRKFPRLTGLRSGGIAGQRLLTYSSILPDWWWSAGADWLLGEHRLNVEYLADRSIFGELDTRTVSAAWRLPLGRNARNYLDLRVGSSNPEGGESQVFGLLGWTGLF